MWCGSGTIIHIHVDSDPFRFAGSCPACYHFINIHVLSGPFRFAGSWQAYYHFVDSCDQWSIIVSCDPATSVPLFFPTSCSQLEFQLFDYSFTSDHAMNSSFRLPLLRLQVCFFDSCSFSRLDGGCMGSYVTLLRIFDCGFSRLFSYFSFTSSGSSLNAITSAVPS